MLTSPDIISKTDSSEYLISRLSKDNIEDLAALHAEVYGVVADPKYFQHKYATAYTGVENVGFIAYSADHQPVAYYGVIPCFIEYENEVMLAAQSADTMTHPRYRYKGMFVELSNRVFELCRQLGIRLVFGFPNQNSYHGAINKLGWNMTEAMSCFIISIKTLPLVSVAGKARIFKSAYTSYSRFITSKKLVTWPALANTVLMDGFAGVHRSREYLDYKKYSPSKVIAVKGAAIWISEKHGMMIGDMNNVDETNFDAVMRKLKSIAGWLGIRQVQFHCSPGTELHRLFSQKFTATPSYPVLFQDFGSAIPPEKVKFTFADIDIF